ncbi:hypothetical protein CFC35_05570 [Streptomyces sp. FBKL.4005]|uniref:hypothetical protein n=1 Tax=unclassified Streptomyces TaxID=2593676 RepID=UPI000B95FFD1|nr:MULTISPECIES: hypothetical protein [unclassified Streptomyces]OYP14034.1 hypothetical protein CFC35_05570 [Streptomyces sp. FBKL.4005]BCM70907.1 hypothetical protein EASAB2608_06241 [Streptomyces sp. EAS-AB2608]
MNLATELRTAAEKLRRDAEAAHRASPAPWTVTDEHVVRCADGMIVADRSGTDHPAERADIPYIAAMDPTVGTLLAQLLDVEADVVAARTAMDGTEDYAADYGTNHLLDIARLINGTTEETA